MKPEGYRYPLLCILFRVLACLNFVVFGISLIGIFTMSGSAGASEAFVTLLGSLFAGLLLLGLSELIEHISRMAFHTRLIWEAVDSGSAKASVSTATALPIKPSFPVENIIRQRARQQRFFYSIAGNVNGPVERKELERLRAAGTIEPTTFVCADGSNDWQSFDDFAATA